MPIQSINVQAFVSEPVKPALDVVVNYNAGLCYVSQTDEGEFILGGANDGYPSFARRGSFSTIEDVVVRAIQILPFLSSSQTDATLVRYCGHNDGRQCNTGSNTYR